MEFTLQRFFPLALIMLFCPGLCGSVDWAPACKPKDRWFCYQSGHMPGLWVSSPVGGTQEASTHWCFSSSLPLSLPLSLPKIPLTMLDLSCMAALFSASTTCWSAHLTFLSSHFSYIIFNDLPKPRTTTVLSVITASSWHPPASL